MSRTITLKSCAVRGPKGPAGKSAYEAACDGGYNGTEDSFADALALIQQAIPMIVTATVLASEQDASGYALTSVELSEGAEDVIGAIAAGRYVAIDLEFDGHVNRLHVVSYTNLNANFAAIDINDTEFQDGMICHLYVPTTGPASGHYSIT